MELIKKDSNTEFDVLYSDGSKCHVPEGVLLECKDNKMVLHLGTSRANVIFAAIESLYEFVYMFGLQDLLDEYLSSSENEPGSASKEAVDG